jgi:hypothetical protein
LNSENAQRIGQHPHDGANSSRTVGACTFGLTGSAAALAAGGAWVPVVELD